MVLNWDSLGKVAYPRQLWDLILTSEYFHEELQAIDISLLHTDEVTGLSREHQEPWT